MSHRKPIYFTLLFLIVMAAIMAGIIYYSQNSKLKVVFLDVGQGDSILIQRGTRQILIDGGPDGQKVMEKLGEYVPFWDREIDVVIATHPDQDHISGLVDVMKNYQVGEMIDNGVSSDTQIFRKLKEVEESRGIKIFEARAGMKIKIDEAELSILSPDGNQPKDSPKDTNLSSIVSKLSYGSRSFLFTGDLPFDGEDGLMKNNTDISAKVLKAAHHGSKYATSDEFIDAVRPQEAVISVGKNNRYGHPASEALDRLKNHKVMTRRTDEEGDIEYEY